MLWHGKNFRGFLHHALQVLFDNTDTTLQSTNVEDAIKEVNSNLSTNVVYSDTSCVILSCGHVVTCTFIGISSGSITVPTGYRPGRIFRNLCRIGTPNEVGLVAVDTNGVISLSDINGSATTKTGLGSITWIGQG